MRIITLHSDWISFQPLTKALKSAEEVPKEMKKIDECLVAFCAVEKSDESNVAQAAENAANEILGVAAQVKVKNIVLYPWVHLTSTPSSPSEALKGLLEIEKSLKAKGYVVERAPFGWYKSFSISVKGHPLSELSRIVGPSSGGLGEKKEEKKPGEVMSESLKKEETLRSKYYVLTPEGELTEIEKYKFPQDSRLQALSEYEVKKVRAYQQEPPHIRMMKELELVDNEPGSDAGNLRWYPKGRLIKKLLERHTNNRVHDYGGIEVETPIMYDFEHPVLKSYLNRFPARQYVVKSDEKSFFLRFAACFGQFLMAKDAVLSYKNLPFKIYELTRYSFRREQSGEVAGLRRLRAFTMPDCHGICADVEQAKSEMKVRFDFAVQMQKEMGIEPAEDLEMAIRFTKEFWEKDKEFVMEMVKKWGKPVFVEIWNERIFYFILKYEFNFVDTLGKASALTTDQIDVENGERYGIQFVDRDGQRKYPVILHLSPTGALERILYTLLEKQAMKMKRGEVPSLPLWLSPTQVRIVPISENHLQFANDVANQLELEQIRVDVDDNDETLPKKVRNAEKEWVPYIIVIGDKEMESKKLAVRVRGEKQAVQMALEELVLRIRPQLKGYPYEPIPLSREISKRPIFHG